MTRKGRPVSNKHKVPKKQWGQWSNEAQRVFNAMYYAMRPSMQFAFLHTRDTPAPKEYWETTRWNASWEAACAVDKTSHVAKVAACR